MKIDAIQNLPIAELAEQARPGAKPAVGDASSFGEVLGATLRSTAAAGHEALARADALAAGALDDVHGTMIAAKEAEISLKLVGTIRNKVLDAFHELWRTSV